MTMELGRPVALAVSLAEAKDVLRVEQDDTSMDSQIAIWLKGITAEAEHATRSVFVNRPGTVTLDFFPDSIRLAAPTYSVESVTYTDADGVTQTLDPQDYYVDKMTQPGYIVPARGKAWPATYDEPNAVTVNFTAGRGPTDETVPDEAKNYILAKLQVQFEPPGAGGSVAKPFNVEYLDRLLDGLRVF